MKKRRRYEDYGSLGELNTTPLLDLAFILLVVFIIALPLLVSRPATDPAAPISLPPADAAPAELPPADVHVLAMAADRTMSWDGTPVGPEDLTSILAGFQSRACPVGLQIFLDPALGARDTSDLLEFIRPHGITHILITTEP